VAGVALVGLHACAKVGSGRGFFYDAGSDSGVISDDMGTVPGGGPDGAPAVDAGSGSGADAREVAPPPPPARCSNLQCQQTTCRGMGCLVSACTGGAHTTLSGTAYDPAGRVPLYNVIVYVPNAPLADLPDGVSCDRCDTTISGSPVVKTVSDNQGHFTLTDVPAGNDIPLVVQIGKWRRQITIPTVEPCIDNVLTDSELTRLPRNRREGHIPKIAITTGGFDALECLLREVGVEDFEFTPEDGDGRVNLFDGVGGTNRYAGELNDGAAFRGADGWWEVRENLMRYDLILHSCEGTMSPSNKTITARQAMGDYVNAGGRMFASHWHNYWIEFGPDPFPQVAQFSPALEMDPPNPLTAYIDMSFAKGRDMASWLMNVGASTTLGELVIIGAKHTVDSLTPGMAQRWIYNDAYNTIQYFSFNTPINAMPIDQCGKVVFSDLHLSGTLGTVFGDDRSGAAYPFPTGCGGTVLTPQKKALEFMLFDLSSCLDPTVP
jgi:hypothetical protein